MINLQNILDKNFGNKSVTLTDKVSRTALSLLALDQHETDLAPLYDSIGRDLFLEITKLYNDKILHIPEYKLIRQNEYLIAAYYLRNKKNYSWPDIKRILNVTKFYGYDNPAQFFSSISFAKRMNNYPQDALPKICQELMSMEISDKEWEDFFKK